MRSLSYACAVAWLLASAAAAAADVYRIVAPDGRVTYSDRRPTDAGLRSTVINAPAPTRPVVVPPSPATLLDAATPTIAFPVNSVRPPAVDGAGASAVAAHVMPAPELIEAAIGIVGYQELAQIVLDTCTRAAPASIVHYDDAVRGWRQRNADLIARAERLLASAFSPSERQAVHATAHGRLLPLLSPLESASAASRVKWCDRSADELKAQLMDLGGKPRLAGPVLAYGH